jgi:hypothetical protein
MATMFTSMILFLYGGVQAMQEGAIAMATECEYCTVWFACSPASISH